MDDLWNDFTTKASLNNLTSKQKLLCAIMLKGRFESSRDHQSPICPTCVAVGHLGYSTFFELESILDVSNVCTWKQRTPLFYSIKQNDKQCVKYLLSIYSDDELGFYNKDYHGKTIYNYAERCRSTTIKNLILLRNNF